MSTLSKPWIKSGLRYLAISIAVAVAIAIYSGETDPPKMESFSTSASTVDLTTDTSYSFSGVISDARGIASATLECGSGEGVEFVIVVATTGINKYRVSFGRTSSSPTWVGRWEGNRQRIQFGGLGEVPADTPDLTCNWFAHLKDSLGNEITTPLDVVMTVRN
jgi:hypothetical protein